MRPHSLANRSTKPTFSLPASLRFTATAEPERCGASPLRSSRLCVVSGPVLSASSHLNRLTAYSAGLNTACLPVTPNTSGPKSRKCLLCSMSRKSKPRTRCSSQAYQSPLGAQLSAVSLAESQAKPLLLCCVVAPASLKTAQGREVTA